MTRVLALTNHKGGVGKSTSATNVAFGLCGVLRRMGAPNNRILLIDTDAQGKAREYQLRLRVAIRVHDGKGRDFIATTPIIAPTEWPTSTGVAASVSSRKRSAH